MHITATQMIAHYSVNFDMIRILRNMSTKTFKAITSMVVLVGVTKNCERFFSDICIDFLQVTAARMIIHHSMNFNPI